MDSHPSDRSAGPVPDHKRDGSSVTGVDLHEGVRMGDAGALKVLTMHFLPRLSRQLHHAYRRTPHHILSDATEDALVQYALCPQIFDPTRGLSLERFLYLAAWRNVADTLKIQARQRAREKTYAQEIIARQTVSPSFEQPSDTVPAHDLTRELLKVVERTDRQALRQWLSGETRTGPLAAALEVAHLSAQEQRREVKRFKDRVSKRLARQSKNLSSKLWTGIEPTQKKHR
jgi:hypothetical protein